MKPISILMTWFFLLSVGATQATDSAVARAHMRNGDYAAAYREYRGLAEAGYPAYQNQVAVMHAQGLGVARDEILAHVWYTLSAAQGDQDAMRAKAELEQVLNDQQLARSRILAERYAADYLAPYRPSGWSLD